jgi:hypothetical protein
MFSNRVTPAIKSPSEVKELVMTDSNQNESDKLSESSSSDNEDSQAGVGLDDKRKRVGLAP